MLIGEGIRSAIAAKLKSIFLDVIVYKEKIEQGVRYPHFFILPINTSRERDLGPRGWIYYQVNIRYRLPQDFNSKYGELEQMGTDLMWALDTITVAGFQLRGRDMNYQIVDGVLQFFINFRMRIKQEQEMKDKMETLTNSAEIKEED